MEKKSCFTKSWKYVETLNISTSLMAPCNGFNQNYTSGEDESKSQFCQKRQTSFSPWTTNFCTLSNLHYSTTHRNRRLGILGHFSQNSWQTFPNTNTTWRTYRGQNTRQIETDSRSFVSHPLQAFLSDNGDREDLVKDCNTRRTFLKWALCRLWKESGGICKDRVNIMNHTKQTWYIAPVIDYAIQSQT